MTKVLHLGYEHRYDDIRVYEKECLSLARNGYDVTYVTSNKNSGSEVPGDSEIRRIVIDLLPQRGLRGIKYIQDLKKYLKSTDYDIYHIHEYVLHSVAEFLVRRGKKVIYDIHEDVPGQMAPLWRARLGPLGTPVVKNIERQENQTIRKVAYNIICVPAQMARVSANSRRVRMVCNYPIIRGDAKGHTENSNICYAGGLTEGRGITMLVNAMPKINGRLLLAGHIAPAYLEKLKQLDGWKKVDYLGYLDRDAVGRLYENSSVGVFVAKETRNIAVGLPNKLLEYMEAGLPVVCSDYRLWTEMVAGNHCGICIDKDFSEAEFVKAVNYLLENKETALEMGARGRKAVLERYNWKTQEQELLKVYGELSDHTNPR